MKRRLTATPAELKKVTRMLTDSPRTSPGKRRSEVLFQTAPSAHPSSQGICRRFDVCPLSPEAHRCMNNSSGRCAQTDACCTAERVGN